MPIFPEVPVANSFQFAKAALFPRDADLSLDRELLLRHCLAALPHAGELALDTLRTSAADDRRLSAWLTDVIESRSIQPRPPIKLRPDRLGFDGEALHLDTAAFNVATVEEAVKLAGQILGIVRIRRHAGRGGEARDAELLPEARTRRVAHQHADAEASPRQLGLQEPDDAVLLGGGGFPLPRRIGEVGEHGCRPPVTAVAGEHLDPGGGPGS